MIGGHYSTTSHPSFTIYTAARVRGPKPSFGLPLITYSHQVFECCFRELVWQERCACRQRGQLMEVMRRHYASLFKVRVYEAKSSYSPELATGARVRFVARLFVARLDVNRLDRQLSLFSQSITQQVIDRVVKLQTCNTTCDYVKALYTLSGTQHPKIKVPRQR